MFLTYLLSNDIASTFGPTNEKLDQLNKKHTPGGGADGFLLIEKSRQSCRILTMDLFEFIQSWIFAST